MNLEYVTWCSLCNAKASDGVLTVEDPGLDELIDLPACQDCVDKLNMPKQLELF